MPASMRTRPSLSGLRRSYSRGRGPPFTRLSQDRHPRSHERVQSAHCLTGSPAVRSRTLNHRFCRRSTGRLLRLLGRTVPELASAIITSTRMQSYLLRDVLGPHRRNRHQRYLRRRRTYVFQPSFSARFLPPAFADEFASPVSLYPSFKLLAVLAWRAPPYLDSYIASNYCFNQGAADVLRPRIVLRHWLIHHSVDGSDGVRPRSNLWSCGINLCQQTLTKLSLPLCPFGMLISIRPNYSKSRTARHIANMIRRRRRILISINA